MNILYCGDRNIEDGLMISVLSLLEHTAQPLQIYVLTVDLTAGSVRCLPVTDRCIDYLNHLAAANGGSVKKIDITQLFRQELPLRNMDTRFTPCCMLRLFADEVPEIPDRVLYLDNDVVCREDIGPFYNQDLGQAELAGVLDYYGRWFFRKRLLHMDYLNSGVLLLDMRKIRQSGLFARCRQMCCQDKMFMPDQSAINKLSNKKILRDRRFNEQRKLHTDTVLQHFTTSFRLFPWLHTLTVKPWQIDQVHNTLKIFEYDQLFQKYQEACRAIRTEDAQ